MATDTQSAPETIASPDAVDAQGAEEVAAVDVGGAGSPAYDARDTEGEMDAGTERDGEPPEDVGGEQVAEVTPPPEAGSDADSSPSSPPDSAPDAPNAPDSSSDQPPNPVLLAGPIVLPPAEPVTGTDVKLDGTLLALVRAQRADGESGVLAYVQQHRPGLSVDRLQVEIVSTSTDAGTAVREGIAAAGGTVTASFENHIWAELSLEGVETLVATEAVWTIGVSQMVAQPFAR